MFSFFIASNPDFKYNVTYLTDQISSFNEAKTELEKRFNHFERITAQIRKQTPTDVSGYLIFDKMFMYNINDQKNEKDSELINVDQYRFDKIDAKNYIVKFILGDKNDPKKIETYKIARETMTDTEFIRAIEKRWTSFIK